METKLSLSAAYHIAEMTAECKELDLKVSSERMSYILTDHNGNGTYRVSLGLDTTDVSISSVEESGDERIPVTLFFSNIEKYGEPVYLTQDYYDIPVLSGIGVNYIFGKICRKRQNI